MTTQEITQIYLHSTGLSWDKYPANNASLENIDLLDLVSSGLFEQIGTKGMGTAYVLKGHNGANGVTKGS